MAQLTCKERIREERRGRISDLTKLWKLYQEGNEDGDPDLGNFYEYGLAFDYVPPGTFNGQRRGYWRYQLSWGGPSDEFRFFCDERRVPVRIEYWFLDWGDGAKSVLKGKDEQLLLEIWDFFQEVGSVDAEYDKAMES